MRWDRLCRKAPLLLCVLVILGIGCLWSPERSKPVFVPARFEESTLVIDPGHGGEDGGAVSPTGTVESHVNLEISTRLDLLLGLYGVNVLMLRTEDVSLHSPDAGTVRERKSSDLRNRAAIVESAPGAVLMSIHQNSYSGSSRYHGAQVFYSNETLSADFAEYTQEILRRMLDPNNTRQAAAVPNTVYLLNHVTCRAILVECGFLSNPEEDALLQSGAYQTKVAFSLAGAYLGYKEGS